MQKAISLLGFWKDSKQPYYDTTELNKALEEGWKVVSCTAGHMGGGGDSYSHYIGPMLVILEK